MVVNGFADAQDDDRREPTMTLTGWRRFVEAPPATFDLLSEDVWQNLPLQQHESYDEARINYHSEMVVVATSTVRDVAKQGRLLTLLNRREISARRGLIVSGPWTTGKSTALKQLGRAHELMVRQRHPGQERIPVVYVTTPPKGSPRKLAMEFARFLGLPPIKRGYNTTDIADAVCQILIEARCELVLVDEIHNLNLATSAGEDMSDHLKYFTEHLPATFVYAGINVERSGLFTGVRGKQIAGRCVLINTGAFPYRAEWQGLVATMETALRLHRHKTGTLVQLDKYLHRRTSGMIGSLSHLVRAAALTAILDGTEAITRELLDSIPVDHAVRRRIRCSRLGMTGIQAASLMPVRPLPRRVSPMIDETLNSYLARVAWANRLSAKELRLHLSGSLLKSIPVPPSRLATVTGCSELALRSAILELSDDAERAVWIARDRPWHRAMKSSGGCRLCLIRYGINAERAPGIVRRRHREDVVCRRHRRWIADSDSPSDRQPDLSVQPDILRAHQLHRRLIHRYGRGQIHAAYPTAEHIWRCWQEEGICQERFHRRMICFHGPDWHGTVRRNDPLRAAAAYPEVIALTRLLVSPYWRSLAMEGTWGAMINLRFLAEVRHTLAPSYVWFADPYHRTRDPLVGWVLDQREYRDDAPWDLYTDSPDDEMLPHSLD